MENASNILSIGIKNPTLEAVFKSMESIDMRLGGLIEMNMTCVFPQGSIERKHIEIIANQFKINVTIMAASYQNTVYHGSSNTTDKLFFYPVLKGSIEDYIINYWHLLGKRVAIERIMHLEEHEYSHQKNYLSSRAAGFFFQDFYLHRSKDGWVSLREI